MKIKLPLCSRANADHVRSFLFDLSFQSYEYLKMGLYIKSVM
jgi:hypothetical protein